MYPYARSQGLGQAGAMAAAIGYMFAGKWMFHLLDAGHYILIGLAWLPLLLLLLEAAIRRGSLVRATAAGAVFALIVLSTHPQWTFYSALFAAAWTLGTALESAGDGKWAARSASGIRSTDSRSESATLSAGDGKWAACSASGIRSTDSRSESATLTLTALMRWAGVGMWMALIAGALSAVQLLPMLEAASQASRGPGVPPDDLAREFAPMIHQLVGPSSAVDDRWEQRAGLGVLWLAAALLAPVLRGGRVRWQTGVWVLLWALALGGGTLLQERRWLGFGAFRLHVRLLIVAALPTALLVGVTTDALFEKAAAWSRGRRIVCLVLVAFALTAGGPGDPLAKLHAVREPRARPWAPSLVDMPRTMAASFVSLANCGKFSLISTPGAAVWMGLSSPASVVPGLRSKVSLWLGPPSIHRRMQALCLAPDDAARAANTLNQPDIAAPPTPAADSFMKSRRDRPLRKFMGVMGKILSCDRPVSRDALAEREANALR